MLSQHPPSAAEKMPFLILVSLFLVGGLLFIIMRSHPGEGGIGYALLFFAFLGIALLLLPFLWIRQCNRSRTRSRVLLIVYFGFLGWYMAANCGILYPPREYIDTAYNIFLTGMLLQILHFCGDIVLCFFIPSCRGGPPLTSFRDGSRMSMLV